MPNEEGIVFNNYVFDPAAIQKRLNQKTSKVKVENVIPQENEKQFRDTIIYGWRRMRIKYGEGSELNLSDIELKNQIVLRKKELGATDSDYFASLKENLD